MRRGLVHRALVPDVPKELVYRSSIACCDAFENLWDIARIAVCVLKLIPRDTFKVIQHDETVSPASVKFAVKREIAALDAHRAPYALCAMSVSRSTVLVALALAGCGRLNFRALDAGVDARASAMDAFTPDAHLDALAPDADLDAFTPDADLDAFTPDAALDAFTPDALSDAGSERANFAFVTEQRFTGALGGVAGADARCQSEAAAAGLVGDFVAMIRSTDRPNPAALLAGSRGWVMRDGKWVADLPEQIVDGAFFHPVYAYANGTRVDTADDGFRVWTGDNGENCANWTSETGTGDQHWIPQWRRLSDGELDCAFTWRLFCFERGHNLAFVAPPITQPLIFVSQGLWAPSSMGVASADALCESEALAAGIADPVSGSTFQALLPLGDLSALARTGGARSFQRVDGIVLGIPGSETTQETYVVFDATGAPPADMTGIWTGGDPTAPSTNTCGSWRLSTGSGNQGGAGDWLGFEGGTELCSTPLHVYCVER